jgi:hypothetical protein
MNSNFIVGRIYQRIIDAKLSNKKTITHGIDCYSNLQEILNKISNKIDDINYIVYTLPHGYAVKFFF